MMLVALLGIPLVASALLVRARGDLAAWLHRLAALATLLAAVVSGAAVVRDGPLTALGGVLRADMLSAYIALLIAVVGALAGLDAPRYLAGETAASRLTERQARLLYPLFHLFVFTMLLAVTTDNLGVMWVAVEGTTLASAFLVNLERSRASLEAAYKYLLISSVGIAVAFIGTVLVYFAHTGPGVDQDAALRWTALLAAAPGLSPRVLVLAFVFIVVGYGTKAGLAPMHTWLPDAHSEAPAPVSALMSGVLLNVGLYAVLRFRPVVDAAAGPEFSRALLLGLGLGSMALAAAFLWAPRNYKRMLAYSSVEHSGLTCLGLGFGGTWGTVGALLHMANHALAKSVLFLASGRIRARFGSAEIADVRGLRRAMPVTGALFLAAVLALIGLPPFGLFVSEFMILTAGFASGPGWIAAVALGLLVVVFAAILGAAHRMLFGPTPEGVPSGEPGRPYATPGAAAIVALVLIGIAMPSAFSALLARVAEIVSR
jgi:hydrogenase-4 component F